LEGLLSISPRSPCDLFPNVFLFIVQEFDIATHLDTVPELVDRVYNRPTIATLQKETLKGATDPAHLKVVSAPTICSAY